MKICQNITLFYSTVDLQKFTVNNKTVIKMTPDYLEKNKYYMI